MDASLWYVVAVGELLDQHGAVVSPSERARLLRAVKEIVGGYAAGARYGIRMDEDGLIAAGVPGVQLTWMDAKIGDWVVTPRIGKPVEIQALWLNALDVAHRHGGHDEALRWFACAHAAFVSRFWHEESGSLCDVVDVDHRQGTVDTSFRPNQLLAVGGLPLVLVDSERARRIVDGVERRLWTAAGPRSLAPHDARYTARYQGGPRERDAAYHQGTVWPWLAGAFVEAWVRVRGTTAEAKREARARFLEPLLRSLDSRGLGQLAEVADAEPPHRPGGCPFQAWSVAEALRLDRRVLAEPE